MRSRAIEVRAAIMRPEAEMTAAAAAARTIPHHLSPPPPTASSSSNTTCDPQLHNCKWWPYSNSSSFGVNTAMILIILFCALTCALALNTAIRCFLRGGSHRPQARIPQSRQEIDQEEEEQQKRGAKPLVVAPTVVYSAGMKLGGAAADCAICLSEFVEGEGIRVLGNCKHGFHIHCIEKWLTCHSSCPVCRTSCLASSASASSSSSLDTAQCCPQNATN